MTSTTETPQVTPEPAPAVATTPVPGPTNGLAIAALVVGIVAFISGWAPIWGLLAGGAAVVLGILGLKKPGGKGMAIAGIITGGLGALWGLVVTIIFFLALVAGLSGIGAAGEIVKEANDQLSQSQQMIDAKKDFAKGETAKIDGLEVKVNSVQRDYTPDNSYMAAAEGKELIVVNYTVKNVGEDSKYVSSFTFSLNENGVADGPSFVTVEPAFDGGDVSPGASITGNVVFEVSKGATDLKLQYETTVLDKNYDTKRLVFTLAI